jgi:DNA-binding transcriptional ArsR family regulator
LVKAIGDPLRWEILRQLASGEPRMVVEIAGALRKQPTLISKHLVWLREAGAVEKGRAQLYTIPRRFLPSPGDGVVDFGHCVLRMGRQA